MKRNHGKGGTNDEKATLMRKSSRPLKIMQINALLYYRSPQDGQGTKGRSRPQTKVKEWQHDAKQKGSSELENPADYTALLSFFDEKSDTCLPFSDEGDTCLPFSTDEFQHRDCPQTQIAETMNPSLQYSTVVIYFPTFPFSSQNIPLPWERKVQIIIHRRRSQPQHNLSPWPICGPPLLQVQHCQRQFRDWGFEWSLVRTHESVTEMGVNERGGLWIAEEGLMISF